METQQFKEGDKVSEWDLFQQNNLKKRPKGVYWSIIKENSTHILQIGVSWNSIIITTNDSGKDVYNTIPSGMAVDVKICKKKIWKIKKMK